MGGVGGGGGGGRDQVRRVAVGLWGWGGGLFVGWKGRRLMGVLAPGDAYWLAVGVVGWGWGWKERQTRSTRWAGANCDVVPQWRFHWGAWLHHCITMYACSCWLGLLSRRHDVSQQFAWRNELKRAETS